MLYIFNLSLSYIIVHKKKKNIVLNVPSTARKLFQVMICPDLVSNSNYSSPAIKWHQTDLTVVICIQLTDVSDYYLRVEGTRLQFSTKTNDKEYYLILHLFGAVIAEKTVHKNVGREIKIYLVKGLKWYSWLRLIKSKEKHPLISYNLEHIRETDHVEKPFDVGRFERYKREHNIQNIMPVVPSSDEESEDEEVDFTHFG
ncbi:putative ATP-dependent RNA helicase TDRD12 isoform X2 [Temnothorax americanus]|uniref:putative ATP-dependent RNA helicase TDRD12 isoform X2 n=1 Tax=Temnothorax americanus TaxID=1964332 RepID=UPI0040682CC1